MNPAPLDRALSVAKAAASEAPYTEEELAKVVKYRLSREDNPPAKLDELSERAAAEAFKALDVKGLRASAAMSAAFGWAVAPATSKTAAALIAVGENFSLF